MKGLRIIASALVFIPALTFPCVSVAVSEAGDTVTKRGNIDDDYYAAGGVVDIDAEIDGDVIVAGGELYIGHLIEGDVIAVGGTLKIRGEIKDDIRRQSRRPAPVGMPASATILRRLVGQ